MLLTKKWSYLRYAHSLTSKSILCFCPLLILIVLVVCFKSTYLGPQQDSPTGSNMLASANSPEFWRTEKLGAKLKPVVTFEPHKSKAEFSSHFKLTRVDRVTWETRNSVEARAVRPESNLQPKAFPTTRSKFVEVAQLQLRTGGKKFDNEGARPVGFPANRRQNVTAALGTSQKLIYLATKYFGEWNPKHFYFPHLGNATFTRYPCPISDCYVTNDPSDLSKSDAVLFHVRDLEVFSIPPHRTPQQIWIIYSMEPPWLEIKDMRRFNGLFNWTMSYRRNSDVLVKYGFIGRKKPVHPPDSRQDAPHFQRKSNKAVWYVSNCQTDSNREEYVAHLRKVYPVDVVGGCGSEGCRPAETRKCYREIAVRYKFYLAFENALCQDYVTEKLFNSLAYDIIPVTFGGVNYSDITPSNSVINALEFGSPDELGRYLRQVSSNETLYRSYFAWKDTYRPYLQAWMCDLCEKLHAPRTHAVKVDLESWWNEQNSCRRWSPEGLLRVEKHAFPKYKARLFDKKDSSQNAS